MREKYESLPLATLKDLAKARGLRGISTLRKPELINRMLEEDEKEAAQKNAAPKVQESVQNEKPQEVVREQRYFESGQMKDRHVRSFELVRTVLFMIIMRDEIIRSGITIRNETGRLLVSQPGKLSGTKSGMLQGPVRDSAA